MAEILYKPSEIIKEAKITRARLHQLLKGYKRKGGDKVEAVLIMNDDYTYIRGDIKYTEQGLRKIKNQKREKNKDEKLSKSKLQVS